jgi:hypothetical protein
MTSDRYAAATSPTSTPTRSPTHRTAPTLPNRRESHLNPGTGAGGRSFSRTPEGLTTADDATYEGECRLDLT